MIQTRKAQELEVVELAEDLPEYGLSKGDRGVVVIAFDQPDEAYDLEFVAESGASTMAYSVKPQQIRTAEETAKELFECGLTLFQREEYAEAERVFRLAIDASPSYLAILHNWFVNSLTGSDDWLCFVTAFRFVLQINPDYEIARRNLVMAYVNVGIEKVRSGDIDFALDVFYRALGTARSNEDISSVRHSLAAAYTEMANRAHEKGDHMRCLECLSWALSNEPNEITRYNFGVGNAVLAYSRLEDQKADAAVNLFEAAIDAGLLLPEILNDYGVSLSGSRRSQESVRAFERALALAPNDDVIKSNLGRARSDAERALEVRGLSLKLRSTSVERHDYHLAA